MVPIKKRKIGICILLSILTLGIYKIYWANILVRNVRIIQNKNLKKRKCAGEAGRLVFIPIYSSYWWFTRGKNAKEKFAENGYSFVGNKTLFLILSIFGYGIVSMAIMQGNFNSLPSEYFQTAKQEDLSSESIQESQQDEVNSSLEKSIQPIQQSVQESDITPQLKKAKTMKEKDLKKVVTAQRVFKIIAQILLYLFLGVMALMIIFPFYWMIISSLKSVPEYELPIPTLFPTQGIMWSNYVEAVKAASLFNLFKNTVIVGIVSTLLSLVITVISAFVFARLEFKGRDTLFAILLGTMMIPGELFTITNYVTVSKWGWVSTGSGNDITALQGFGVLIVPFLISIFYIYLLKQNFMQIPNELYLAAKVDGTKDLKYLWKVMIPLALPTLISITILKMMGAWNSYVWPRLVSPTKYHLITNGLRTAFQDANTGVANIPQQMAAVTLVSIPLFLVFIFLRKYIMKGVSRSGIKG